MTKIYCGRYSCQYCFGEVCGKETVKINSDGCHSYKCVNEQKESTTWSTNPWENYTPPSELADEYRKRSRLLLREDKISKDDVNQES